MQMTGFLFAIGCLFSGIILGALVGLALSLFCYALNNDFDSDAVMTLTFVLAVVGAVIGLGVGITMAGHVVIMPTMVAASGGGTWV